jgi:hypothetical protein
MNRITNLIKDRLDLIAKDLAWVFITVIIQLAYPIFGVTYMYGR